MGSSTLRPKSNGVVALKVFIDIVSVELVGKPCSDQN